MLSRLACPTPLSANNPFGRRQLFAAISLTPLLTKMESFQLTRYHRFQPAVGRREWVIAATERKRRSTEGGSHGGMAAGRQNGGKEGEAEGFRLWSTDGRTSGRSVGRRVISLHPMPDAVRARSVGYKSIRLSEAAQMKTTIDDLAPEINGRRITCRAPSVPSPTEEAAQRRRDRSTDRTNEREGEKSFQITG